MSTKKKRYVLLSAPWHEAEFFTQEQSEVEIGDEDEAPEDVDEDPEAALLDGMIPYIKAHALLPVGYFYDGSVAAVVTVEKAANELMGARTNGVDRLRAILVLGHSPCKRAVEALSAFAKTDHALAETAGFALSECLQLFMTPYAGVISESFQRGDIRLSFGYFDMVRI